MVQRLLASREDVFPDYTEDAFRAAFERNWIVGDVQPVEGTPRSLWHLTRR